MNWTTSFLSDQYFYSLLVIGTLAMIPRARYVADRILSLKPEEIKPNFAQRVCIFIPGICVFACIGMFRYALGAIVLLVAYIVGFALLTLLFKKLSSR
ncbi:MAG: hypothetical protein AAGH99_05815 [Planctomycetota bacterium]